MAIKTVLEWLERSAGGEPGKVIFTDDQGTITYADFVARAKALGARVAAEMGSLYNQPIVVFIDRSIESLVAMMAVVYSGNFYSPVDRDLPPARINAILAVLQPKLVLSTANDQIPEGITLDTETRQLTTRLDLPLGTREDAVLRDAQARATSQDPLYTIFTSGSTGTPKGVVISHKAVIDFIDVFSETFELSASQIFGNLAPFDFDVSVKDIYSTFRNGSSAVIIPKRLIAIPAKFIQFLDQHQVNCAIWATSALRILENFRALDEFKPRFLRRVMFSGEVMPNKVLNYWRSHLPLVTYVNLYGPTEVTCNCAYFEVDRPFADDEALPIGKAFSNCEILLLSGKHTPTREGETGEICVRGPSLALGYYDDIRSTAKAFCQNPLNPYFRDLIYRTGDLGRVNPRGEFEFLGRKDLQIKHLGHRIELAEIEILVNSLPYIEAGVCMYDETGEQIVLFYQSKDIRNKEIYLGLKERLPKYSIPNVMLRFEKLPLNKNGKIDRQLLLANYLNRE